MTDSTTDSTTDWTTEAVDYIERAVATVRDKTVVPARTATRAVVYGLLAAFFVGPALVFLTVLAFRLLVVACQGEVWGAWLGLGGIFLVAGGFIWSKRNPRTP